MFTGIVQAIGTVRRALRDGSDLRVTVAAGDPGFTGLVDGESICVNGVCLTVTGARTGEFDADVSAATLECTTLGGLLEGSRVNLERSLRASDRLGGHLVSGHVDGVGRVVAVGEAGGSMRVDVEAPAAVVPYLCVKGSICVDGVSLTVNEVTAACFSVNIIPHTRGKTTLSGYAVGTKVNLEADLIARYLESLVRDRG